MVENLGHIVNGKSMHDSGAPIEIFNPSNGKVISTISNASDKTIELREELCAHVIGPQAALY